jgi:hypothetical protein
MSKKIEDEQESNQTKQPSYPTSYLKEGSKMERKARSKPRSTYPRAHKWKEAVPLLLLHYEPLTSK